MPRTPKRPPPTFGLEFDHTVDAPSLARHALNELLPDPDDPLAVDVALAASELVSNVVLHTADGGLMEAWDVKPGCPLRLEVSDSDARALVTPADQPRHDGGRGLRIVDAIADEWGVRRGAAGKVVWAEFSRSGATYR